MESRDRDRLEQWLDGALRQRDAEPRPGLEGRILARIAAESKRHRTPKSWAWGFAAASVAVLFLVFGPGVRQGSKKAPPVAGPPASRTSGMARPADSSASGSLRPFVRNRPDKKPAGAIVRTVQEPRLDHFPSRRRLSEQERALENYAERFPAEAALIAREQQKFDQEIATAQEEAENGSSPNQ